MATPLLPGDVVLTPESPREEYRPHLALPGLHWAARKVFLAQVQFLTLYWDGRGGETVIVVPSTPSASLSLLSLMFPALSFRVYTEEKGLPDLPNVLFVPRPFSEQEAREKRGALLFADARSAEVGEERWRAIAERKGEGEVEAKQRAADRDEDVVWNDMRLQERWVTILRPVAASLRFRLPYPMEGRDREETYLGGTIFKEAWTPATSTETRLVVTSPERVPYSLLSYEQQLFYHNARERDRRYANFFSGRDEPYGADLLNDFDGSLEIFILSQYVSRFSGKKAEEGIVLSLSEALTSVLDAGRSKERLAPSVRRPPPRARRGDRTPGGSRVPREGAPSPKTAPVPRRPGRGRAPSPETTPVPRETVRAPSPETTPVPRETVRAPSPKTTPVPEITPAPPGTVRPRSRREIVRVPPPEGDISRPRPRAERPPVGLPIVPGEIADIPEVLLPPPEETNRRLRAPSGVAVSPATAPSRRTLSSGRESRLAPLAPPRQRAVRSLNPA